MDYSIIWTAYDKAADVLYINFKKPSHADDSELTDDDVIIRYEKGEIVGHILFFPIMVKNVSHAYPTLALAPMAVLQEFQSKGIGKKLIKVGLEHAHKLGYTSVIVLGHPRYYPKLGFRPASQFGIKPPFEVPEEAFMAIELEEHALDEISGIVQYPKEHESV